MNVPTCDWSHQHGHVAAALYSCGRTDLLKQRFLAFHVSGGTTECVLVERENEGFRIELLGGTADLNAGQAIDRIGVALGLKFPCGPEMEKLALNYSGEKLNTKISVKDNLCNLSGLENNSVRMIGSGAAAEAVCPVIV